ncbi:MAG: hypothetical protein JKY61_07795 [Planctomycetes bacterium]|nr:hypothetical protein [Planctomycetota bacterium]
MHESTFEFTNDRDASFEVILEPYGMPYSVPPGATLRVEAQGEAFGELTVETDDRCIVIYSWATSTAKVYIGPDLVDDHDTPVPGIPWGMRMRGFVDMLFGGPGHTTEKETDAGRNRYVGSRSETPCRLIDLPWTTESVRTVLDWGAAPASSPHTHQEIAHWCDRFHMEHLDTEPCLALERALQVAVDVDCQWDLFLANTYTLKQLRHLDFSTVTLPTEWFDQWLLELQTA